MEQLPARFTPKKGRRLKAAAKITRFPGNAFRDMEMQAIFDALEGRRQ